MLKKNLKNQKGFTLIEIIAVLVILGILAAVAVPKYMDMQGEAKRSTAKGQVAEIKSTLNMAYAKVFMSNGSAPSAIQVVTSAGIGATMGVLPDLWNVSVSARDTTTVDISVTGRGTPSDADYNATGTWNIPQ